jgi:hypothetical protein
MVLTFIVQQETSWDIVEEVATWEKPGSRDPLLEMHFTLKNNLNANVSTGAQVFDTISVRADTGWSPSLTFPVRQGIIRILAPTTEVLGGISRFIVLKGACISGRSHCTTIRNRAKGKWPFATWRYYSIAQTYTCIAILAMLDWSLRK